MTELPPVFAAALDGRTIRMANGEVLMIDKLNVPSVFAPATQNEMILGLRARERIQAMIDSSGPVEIHRGPTDDEGRIIVSIRIDNADIAATMIAEGYGVAPGTLPFWD